MDCPLCSPSFGPVVGESPLWRVVVNINQDRLGKVMLVCRRHVEPVVDLTTEEWQDLQALLRRVTGGLIALFHPPHFNYAFLQNQDRHVHLHVVPRYDRVMEFAGERFDDPDYPSPSGGTHRVGGATLDALASALRGVFAAPVS